MGALIASDGSGTHPHLRRLIDGSLPLSDIADAAHFVCGLHGRRPGVVDHAQARARLPLERDWIEAACEAFALERGFLVRLAAAAGPLPRTPAQAESTAAAQAQRQALDTLAQSDRAGCATGAAMALLMDWLPVRAMLDAAADRLGATAPAATLPPAAETFSVIDALARQPAMERAMLFGAQQLLAQHRCLWDLLEARAGARAAA